MLLNYGDDENDEAENRKSEDAWRLFEEDQIRRWVHQKSVLNNWAIFLIAALYYCPITISGSSLGEGHYAALRHTQSLTGLGG